jgi:kumamolisin
MPIHPYIKGVYGRPHGPARRKETPHTSWTIPALCAAYQWPVGASGKKLIAIIELGGGYHEDDVTQAFTAMGLPAPSITDVSVDGTTNNNPGTSNADGEVALDIQVAGAAYAVATGEAAEIVMFWAQDIASAITAAAKYGCHVCSISWGADEAEWGQEAGEALEAAAAEAVLAGMIVFAASGDNDSSDGGPTPANVDLPASAPHVIACGGTSKPQDGPEVVWNNNPNDSDGEGTGGGFSTLFPVQAWQIGAPKPPKGLGRMVPDVSANADPQTGYEIVLKGQVEVFGGTSAVAPLYAGLFAAIGGEGFVTPALYQNHGDFTDITVGNNGLYDAGKGPDPCTGIGSPIGIKIAGTLDGPLTV